MVRLFQSWGIFAVVARLRLATFPVDACRACYIATRWRMCKREGPGHCPAPGPPFVSTGGPRGSAQRHFRDEQVIAARPVHVRVEDHHLAVGTRFPPRD